MKHFTRAAIVGLALATTAAPMAAEARAGEIATTAANIVRIAATTAATIITIAVGIATTATGGAGGKTSATIPAGATGTGTRRAMVITASSRDTKATAGCEAPICRPPTQLLCAVNIRLRPAPGSSQDGYVHAGNDIIMIGIATGLVASVLHDVF
jgi:hypothetical protein